MKARSTLTRSARRAERIIATRGCRWGALQKTAERAPNPRHSLTGAIMRAYALRLFESPRLPWLFAALAFLLCARALSVGFQADDHILGYSARASAHSFSLFESDQLE